MVFKGNKSSASLLLIFTMLCGYLFGEPSVKNPNLAFEKPTTMSSFSDNITHPSIAVDGSATITISTALCAVTSTVETWQWWMVDLLNVFSIRSFRITVMYDTSSRTDDFVVEVSKDDPMSFDKFPGFTDTDNCTSRTNTEIPSLGAVTFACNSPVNGRYVRYVRENPNNNMELTVCEFEVYSYVEENVTIGTPSSDSLALEKPAWQSSQLGWHEASRAVDGSNVMKDNQGRSLCSVTLEEDGINLWWMVDLRDIYIIDSIRILTVQYCCQNRLRNFTVDISEEDPRTMNGFPGHVEKSVVCHSQLDIVTYTKPVTYKCDRPIVGRFVRVVKNGYFLLSLCEFEVFGKPRPSLLTYSYRTLIANTGNRDGDIPVGNSRSYKLQCARQHSLNIDAIFSHSYMRVKQDDGACSFHRSTRELDEAGGSTYDVYEVKQLVDTESKQSWEFNGQLWSLS